MGFKCFYRSIFRSYGPKKVCTSKISKYLTNFIKSDFVSLDYIFVRFYTFCHIKRPPGITFGNSVGKGVMEGIYLLHICKLLLLRNFSSKYQSTLEMNAFDICFFVIKIFPCKGQS